MDEKGEHELKYWRERKKVEGELSNGHYEYFFTKHFGLTEAFFTDKKIMDIGCGPRGSLEWADMTNLRIGLDPLAEGYRELGTDNQKMQYTASGSETIPYEDGFLDIVSSFNSLDHVDDLDKTVAEIKRVVKPRGTFLLLTEVNHKPTVCEPIAFSWDIIDKFTDALTLVDLAHYEKSKSGIYDSIRNNVAYDHSNMTDRYGILSARFFRGVDGAKR